jgi:hypothetical protein
MLDRVQQLIDELGDDHFRGRKSHNNATLHNEVFSLYGEDTSSALDMVSLKKDSGSKVSAMLITQNLLLLKRVIKLEEKINEIESSRD